MQNTSCKPSIYYSENEENIKLRNSPVKWLSSSQTRYFTTRPFYDTLNNHILREKTDNNIFVYFMLAVCFSIR